MIDYHIHTSLCNHARGGMREYVKKAISLGFKEVCFLDHLIMIESRKNQSMDSGEVPFYFHAVQKLKHEFKDRINVKAGLEVDFDPKSMDHINDVINRFSFDVIGGAIHFLGFLDIVSSKSDWKNGDIEADLVYDLYLSRLKSMLEFDFFDFICHFDLIKKFGHQPNRSYELEFNDILKTIKQKEVAIELNTGGYDHPVGEAYPSLLLLKKLKKAGITLTLGSDAHTPDQVGRHYDRAKDLLSIAGFKELAVFTRRRPKMMPIDF